MSIFQWQLLALAGLSFGTYSGMILETPFGYFCAGINVGGMIYFVVDIPRWHRLNKKHDALDALMLRVEAMRDELSKRLG